MLTEAKTRRPRTTQPDHEPMTTNPVTGLDLDFWAHWRRPAPADVDRAEFLTPGRCVCGGHPDGPDHSPSSTDQCEPSVATVIAPTTDHAPAAEEVTTTPTTGQAPATDHAPLAEDRPAEWRPMTRGQKVMGFVLAPPALALGAAGFTVSFATVQARMVGTFGERAWMVPAGVDLGIIVFSSLHIWLAAIGMRLGWLRLIPWILTAATITLNATAYVHDVAGIVAHTVLPLLWVVVCEVVAHIVAVRTGMRRGERSDPIPLVRWLIAPVPTLLLWRNMRLWGIKSYGLATSRERERLLVRTCLREAYPKDHRYQRWHHNVPPMMLTRYQLRELTLVGVVAEVEERRAQATVRVVAPVVAPAPDHAPPALPPVVTAPVVNHHEPTPAPMPAPPPAPVVDQRTVRAPRTPRAAADQTDVDARRCAVFDQFVTDHKRRPTGAEFAQLVGLKRNGANRWISKHRPKE